MPENTQHIEETVIELTQEQVQTALAQFDVTEAVLANIRELKDVTVAGPEDKKNLKLVKSKHKEIRKLRIDIDKKRKELIRPALDFQNEVNAEAKRLTGEVQPVEDHLKDELDRIEKEKAAAMAKKVQQRRKDLADAGFIFDGSFYSVGSISLHPSALEDADDETMEDWVKKGTAEKQRLKEEEARRKAEEEARKKEMEELEAKRREIERKEAELAKKEKAKADAEAAEQRKKDEAKQAEESKTPPAPSKAPEPPKQTSWPSPPSRGVETKPPHERLATAPPESSTSAAPEDTFEDGFDALRGVVLSQIKKGSLPDGTQITRKSLYKWIQSLKPENYKTPF